MNRASTRGIGMRGRPAEAKDLQTVSEALYGLRRARQLLRSAGCHHAAEAAARAVKSAEGACRHLEGMLRRDERSAATGEGARAVSAQ